jgi:hypothetical protein
MEPTRPAAANRVYDRFQALAGRLISRPLGGRLDHRKEVLMSATHAGLQRKIRASLETRDTEDLLQIWHLNDRSQWTDLALEVVHDILLDRLGEVPLQDRAAAIRANAPPPVPPSEKLLHDSDRVARVSSWASSLSWVFLVLFTITALSELIINVAGAGPFISMLDITLVLQPVITLAFAAVVFTILQGVSQALLLLLDLSLDVHDGLEGVRSSPVRSKAPGSNRTPAA